MKKITYKSKGFGVYGGNMKLSELNNIIDEKVKVIRDGDFQSVMLSGLRFNSKLKTISYILSMNYFQEVKDAGVDCIICPEYIAAEVDKKFNGGIAISVDPKTAFFQAHEAVSKKNEELWDTIIGDNCNISDTAVISPKNVKIGNNVTIDPNVIVYDGVVIEDDVRIMSGSIIGCPAFYYYGEGNKKKIVHSSGIVHIYNGASIHTNVTIQKGVIGGETRIGSYSSIDSCVICHDVYVGDNSIIAAGASVGGWVEIGENTFVGLQASFAPKVVVGKNCKISMGAVVTKDVHDNGHVSGNFAIDHNEYLNHLRAIIK